MNDVICLVDSDDDSDYEQKKESLIKSNKYQPSVKVFHDKFLPSFSLLDPPSKDFTLFPLKNRSGLKAVFI